MYMFGFDRCTYSGVPESAAVYVLDTLMYFIIFLVLFGDTFNILVLCNSLIYKKCGPDFA